MGKGTGNYYTPRSLNLSLPGVRKISEDYYTVTYGGSMESLASAGLADLDMFPGQPGRSATSSSYRPSGAKQDADDSWFHVPRMITITRQGASKYAIRMTISREERSKKDREREQVFRQRGASRPPSMALTVATSVAPRNRGHLRLVWSAPA